MTTSPPMTYTYDIQSADATTHTVSALRLVLGDTDLTQIATPPRSTAFADQEYAYFWEKHGSPPDTDLDMVIVDLLLSIANNKARLASFVQLQGGGSVDMRQMAAELRAQAEAVRSNYYSQPAEAYAESNWGDFSWRQLLYTQSLRAAVNTAGPVGP